MLRKCATFVIAVWVAYVISVAGFHRDPVTAIMELARWMEAHGF
jgi:hypothetical protein